MESIGDPNVVTFDPISDEEQVLANGAVVDMEPEGFRLGFILREISTGKETDFPAELIGNSAVFYASLTGLKKGSSYSVQAYAVDKDGHKTSGNKTDFVSPIDVGDIIQTGEYVDLGLPSGLKWATCNLGASKPEEYGGYYQWAGTKDVTDTSIYLDYSNCPYHTGSSYNTGWTKYIPSNKSSYWSGSGSPDNKTVLDSEDDVAHAMLGGSWRMPTLTEFEELWDNCSSEWTTLNGVNGRMFTSKKNGNSIFLPAAGYRFDDGLDDVGSRGHYWSSSLNTGIPVYACDMFFSSGSVSTYYYYRFIGQSVRPVSE